MRQEGTKQEGTRQLIVVGLGPGDPELVTVKGRRAIEAADLVFVPRSHTSEESRALHIARPWLNPQRQQVVLLTLPMTRDATHAAETYRTVAEEIGTRLADQRRETARGVYLLLGDPLLYGTFTCIWGELVARWPSLAVEVVPGVTSFAAAAAQVGLPLSTHQERVAIVPASEQLDSTALEQLCASFETVIVMKVGRVLPQLIAALDTIGLLDRAIYAEHIGMPEERIVRDPGSLRDYQGPYLSLLIVRQKGENEP
ncbi:MAG: precorrin-2 C(20)-methyltransferase [Chloroflexaceae bacterium]|nr:precorrin-2 C(20)-methyltransferase [Chloroflexaceae bacterium]